MKNNSSLVYAIFLVIGDFFALVGAFTLAYILRVKYDPRPLIEQIPAETYLYGFIAVLPLWILVHALIGLYRRDIYENRFREFGRLILGSILGILVIIGYDFVIDDSLFPARLVAVYGFLLSFGFLVVFRALARGLRSVLFGYGIGVNNVLIIGSGVMTQAIVEELEHTRRSGHRILGIVGQPYHGFDSYPDFDTAIQKLGKQNLHSIIQTELYKKGELNDSIMSYAQANHMAYRFIPGNSELFVGNIEVELFRGTPVITVHQTAIVGWGKVVKRLFDLFVGGLLLILASPVMLIVALMMKFQEPRGAILFRQTRLTQFDKPFLVYKFRTVRTKYNGMTPEEAFAAMGRPEMAKVYRASGDAIENDPRFTGFSRFLRSSSLDELPQLINVVKGDISLVGPRALIPQELKSYKHKHHILSVKSGVTGLAQVSGRRDISFEERRKLDTYYVQNWSFWLDLSILLRTLRAVINKSGAK
jgi:exopolysaccharide biosynthesis polyprenyl glycosylphosphotransferase